MIAVLLLGGVVGALARWRARWRRIDRRIGLLGAPAVPKSKAEADRAARLLQLGKVGTIRVYNCGKILHVDYDRGEFVVQRRAARRQRPGVADVYRVHNCGKILHVDYDRGELIVERERS